MLSEQNVFFSPLIYAFVFRSSWSALYQTTSSVHKRFVDADEMAFKMIEEMSLLKNVSRVWKTFKQRNLNFQLQRVMELLPEKLSSSIRW